jgi:hypothetical protein
MARLHWVHPLHGGFSAGDYNIDLLACRHNARRVVFYATTVWLSFKSGVYRQYEYRRVLLGSTGQLDKLGERQFLGRWG